MSQSHDQEYKLFQFFAQKHCIDLTQIDEELYRLYYFTELGKILY